MGWVLAAVAAMSALTGCSRKKEIWIYTSIYKEVIAEMDAKVKAAVPDADVKWYQGGSENVAAKLNAEIAAGKPKADLILTSDPFWYAELKQNGQLIPYESPAAQAVPAQFKDPEHAFTTVRIPLMVMGYNSEVYPKPADLPAKFKDLTDPKFKEKVSMGSPLESGTNFTTVALLAKAYDWTYWSALRKQEIVAAGGNNSVITRMETRERPVGVVLLENLLKAQSKGSPVRIIYPQDGAIPIPSPIAILKASGQPEVAKKVYDWFFTNEAQVAMVKSGMYSPLPQIAPPEGAKPWAEITKMAWTPEILKEINAARDQIKAKFSQHVLH